MKMKSAAVSAMLALCPLTAWAGSSTFQNSCRNIQMSASEEGVRISAECRTRDGRYLSTSYLVRGIVNNNGQLRGERGAATSFQHSCRDGKLSWNASRITLNAICKTRSGSENQTSIEFLNIENNDGRLVTAQH